jgi:class 3 adenylate cyclase
MRKAFLIADVRGYTRFTRERGDEAAAILAKRFDDLARDAVEARSGLVIELRGDEALAVWAERACRTAGRTLTRDEWRQFLPDRPYRPACASS